VERADVSVMADVRRLLGQMDASMPELRGIVHAAGVLEDTTLIEMDRARFEVALAAKAKGAQNLHVLTLDRQLDHFVLFSSAAGVLGSPAQGNYASANAFLDGLAWHRDALGLPALSVDWGPWSDVGMAAAQPSRERRLLGMGLTPLPPAQALDALAQAMQQNCPQVAVMRLNARQWMASMAGGSTLLAELVGSESAQVATDSMSIRDQVLGAEPAFRAPLLAAHLSAQLAKVLQFSLGQIRDDMPFRNMGMDSLTSLEFKNGLEATLGLRFSAATIWNHPTISKLAVYVAQMLGVSLANVEDRSEHVKHGDDELEGALHDLSDEELARLASEEMD